MHWRLPPPTLSRCCPLLQVPLPPLSHTHADIKKKACLFLWLYLAPAEWCWLWSTSPGNTSSEIYAWNVVSATWSPLAVRPGSDLSHQAADRYPPPSHPPEEDREETDLMRALHFVKVSLRGTCWPPQTDTLTSRPCDRVLLCARFSIVKVLLTIYS